MNGCADKQRLVEELSDLKAFGIRAGVVQEHGLNAVHDVQRRGVTSLIDAHENAALAICKNSVGLRGKAVADVRNVLHVNGGAIHRSDGKVVQFRNAARAAVHLHRVFECSEFGGARWQEQVLRVDCIDDIDGRQTFRL